MSDTSLPLEWNTSWLKDESDLQEDNGVNKLKDIIYENRAL